MHAAASRRKVAGDPSCRGLSRKQARDLEQNFSSMLVQGTVVTEVEPIKNFSEAEEYHQQYLARGGRFGQPQSPAKGCTDPVRCYG